MNNEWVLATLLTDGECMILGTRARIRVEWPDGLPFGWSEDKLRELGEEMKAKAQVREWRIPPVESDQGWRPASGSL